MKSCWAVKKPYINENNRIKRLEWCKERKNWTVEQWKQVVWSDESPFVLRYNGKRRVWRHHNERYNDAVTIGSVKHDAKINVWGCFCAHGVDALHLVEGNMNSKQYVCILEQNLVASAMKYYQPYQWTFQQDNDPKHTSNDAKEYFINNRIIKLNWPLSPPI